MSVNPENGDSGLDEIEKKLYQPGAEFKVRRSELDPLYQNVSRNWETEAILPPARKPNYWLRAFVLSLGFFLLAVIAALYIFTSDGNVVSEKNIELSVLGPVAIKAGDELDLSIGITNKNPTLIDQVELTTVWPTGSKEPSGAQSAAHVTQKIGRLAAGETINVATKALVYGKENDELEVKLLLRYHLAGSNSLFEKETAYRLKVTASPINLSVGVPTEINTNQDFAIDIAAKANSDKTVSDVLVEVVYPAGFQLKSADLPPTYDGNKWRLGDMAPGSERTIHLRGIIEGQDEQLRAFEFKVGTGAQAESKQIAVLYNDLFKTITIKKPFLALSFDEGRNVQTPGKVEKYVLRWVNNLPIRIDDAAITVKFSGNALAKGSVRAPEGYYSSITDTLSWDRHTKDVFASIGPGESGTLVFNFGSPANLAVNNPYIDLDFRISGVRVSEGFAGERIETVDQKRIKIDTVVKLGSVVNFADGPFQNTGPLPPKAETETTYTVTWSLENSLNNVDGGVMEAVLPPGVSWVGMVSPSSERVSFNESERKVVWDLGTLAAGKNGTFVRRAASFQIAIVPSVAQVGSAAPLVSQILFHGRDAWSGFELSIQGDNLNTAPTADSAYRDGLGVVLPK